MKVAFVALLLVAVVLGARHSFGSRSSKKTIEDVKKSRLGSALIELITLHTAVAGPVQELIDAIEELIVDLNDSLEELEFNFNVRTNEHFSLELEYTQNIQDADTDVGRADDLITNLLAPRRSAIRQKIAQIQENMEYNRKTLAETTLLRQQAHEDYEAQVAELNDATDAVDEAIALLNSLTNPSASLIQIKKIKKSLSRVQKKTWNIVKSGPMIQALISLSIAQNFSDQGLVSQVVDALNEFRNEVVNALNELTANEADAVVEYEERVEQLDAEFREFQTKLNFASMDLTATQDKITETQTFRDQREQDRRTYVAQLQLENETYAQETQIYTDLKNEYLAELAAAEQALGVVNSGDFSNIHL